MKALLLTLLLGGAAEAACLTPCGMLADVQDCHAIEDAEARVISAYAGHTKWSAKALCESLKGVVLLVHARLPQDEVCRAPAWYSPPNKNCVLGLTRASIGVVEIERTDDWRKNSYTHELGHIFARAMQGKDANHCGWKALGVWEAIAEATGERDNESVEKCEGKK